MKICVNCKEKYPDEVKICPRCKIVLEFDTEEPSHLRDDQTGY